MLLLPSASEIVFKAIAGYFKAKGDREALNNYRVSLMDLTDEL